MRRVFLLVACTALLAGPAAASRHHIHVGHQSGLATWYGPGFYGRRTASGERFKRDGLTAAHNSLPLGTRVRVTDLRTHRSVTVRINDRGRIKGIIDVAPRVATILRMKHRGIDRVMLAWRRK